MKQKSLISEQQLKKSKKILFIAHLAIGDFTYLKNFFKAFVCKYPSLQVDLLIDDRRGLFSLDKKRENDILLDWVKKVSLFHTVYKEKVSSSLLKRLQKEEYPFVISLCYLKPQKYASYARKISPNGFVAGVLGKNGKVQGLDAVIMNKKKEKQHISSMYNGWFEELFGVCLLPAQRAPVITIPKEWVSYGKLCFIKWGIQEKRFSKVVFLNIFSKNVARCWPLDRLVKLILALKKTNEYSDVDFIINVEPKYYNAVRSFFSNFCLQRVFLFTAKESFFQLPAIISLVDLVVSVETSIIHLAAALQVPVVALMRQKNPEWTPFGSKKAKVLFAEKRTDWVEDIPLKRVLLEVKRFHKQL